MNTRNRCFLGYPLTPHPGVDRLCARLPDDWQLIHPADRHLTLLFLGELGDQQRERIWAQARRKPPPRGEYSALALSGFGHPRSPRTLALTLAADPVADWMRKHTPSLCALTDLVPEARTPLPHISLAYWRGRTPPDFTQLPTVAGLRISLNNLALFQRATAKPQPDQGPRYHCWAMEPL